MHSTLFSMRPLEAREKPYQISTFLRQIILNENSRNYFIIVISIYYLKENTCENSKLKIFVSSIATYVGQNHYLDPFKSLNKPINARTKCLQQKYSFSKKIW